MHELLAVGDKRVAEAISCAISPIFTDVAALCGNFIIILFFFALKAKGPGRVKIICIFSFWRPIVRRRSADNANINPRFPRRPAPSPGGDASSQRSPSLHKYICLKWETEKQKGLL